MKERPILFSGPMVRAILAGRKTQTRRVLKYMQPARRNGYWPCLCHDGVPRLIIDGNRSRDKPLNCPYGVVGDRLWVRETFAPMQELRPIANPERYDDKPAWYRADNDRPTWAGDKWYPSIHMPRWASRLTLEITGIRVERLQEISEDDAIAEGAQCAGFPASLTNRGAFAKLWNEINGNEAWDKNPWVWVIDFTKIHNEKGGA